MNQADMPAGLHSRQIEVEGHQREFLLYVPNDMPPTKWPVVLAFHGSGTHAQEMIQFSRLDQKAQQAKFLAVFPQGTGRIERARSFNAGNCCGYARRHRVDDVAFIRRLIDELARLAPIDHQRIYATGMSNGALLCYLLADRMSPQIAAIAPVAGPMGTESCSPHRPIPICHFHGTADEFASYQGGRGRRSITGTDFYSVEHTIRSWVEANGCDPRPSEVDLPSGVPDGTHITRSTYRGETQASEIVLYTIHGGGHTWPGGSDRMKFLGKTTGNLSANDTLWEFFQRHRLEET